MSNSRSYLQSHPWLTFRLDLSKANFKFWMLLGEAVSKCEHIKNMPLLPSVDRELHQMYLAKGIAATTAIEGNTLTEEQVRKQIEGKPLQLPPSQEYLKIEVDNVLEACNSILKKIHDLHLLSVDAITEYNRIVLQNLQLEEGVIPGKVRTHSVGVGRYKGAPAEDCEYLLERLCQFINHDIHSADLSRESKGILKALLSHLYLAWIHPFGDGNGRTARLIEYQLLLTSGIPSPAAHLLSNHYNQTRNEYYKHLEYASQSGGDIFPFLMYGLQGFVEGLKEQLKYIKGQQWRITWVYLIDEKFDGKAKSTDLRKKQLILALTDRFESLNLKTLWKEPAIQVLYHNKKQRTFERDIEYLMHENLIIETKEGIQINHDILYELLPPVKQNQ